MSPTLPLEPTILLNIDNGYRWRRGAAWAARMHAMVNDYRCCIKCGLIGAPTFACPLTAVTTLAFHAAFAPTTM